MADIDLEDLQHSGPIPSNFNAAEAPNDESIEQQFAVACMEQAETYWNLITKVKPSSLHRLTKYDDEIVDAFTAAFPEIVGDDERIKKVNEDEMKSADGKARWRACMKSFESHPELDYNFGSLVRADCEKDYSEENSIFVLRLQFYAFEILRNRRGLNDVVWEEHQVAK